jgi:hypothetical protein
MTGTFNDYVRFDNKVQQCTDSLHYKEFKYILPTVGIVHHVRVTDAKDNKQDVKHIDLQQAGTRYAGYMMGRA